MTAQGSELQTGSQGIDLTRENGGQEAEGDQGAVPQTADRLAGQIDRVADTVGTVTRALQHAGQRLRAKDHAAIGQYADRAAAQVERLSGYLREPDVHQKVQSVARTAESAARRAGPTVRRAYQGGRRTPPS